MSIDLYCATYLYALLVQQQTIETWDHYVDPFIHHISKEIVTRTNRLCSLESHPTNSLYLLLSDMAPEVYDRRPAKLLHNNDNAGPYDPKKADIWGLGIILSKLILPSQLSDCIGGSPPDSDTVASMQKMLQSLPSNLEKEKVRNKGEISVGIMNQCKVGSGCGCSTAMHACMVNERRRTSITCTVVVDKV